MKIIRTICDFLPSPPSLRTLLLGTFTLLTAGCGESIEDSEHKTPVQFGIASFYGEGFHGNLTANGEIFDQDGISAAHKHLPFNTMVEVFDVETGKSIIVRINDRGPFKPGRIIDLSKGAAIELGIFDRGIADVIVLQVPGSNLQ